MIGEPLSIVEKRFLLVSAVLLLFGFFHNLGIYPLTLEEPRRGLIALELLINDNLWVPTQTGELYYRKPPFYNWLLIGSFKIFGNATEFSIRFFSVLSHLISGLLVFYFTRKYVNSTTAVFAVLGLLVSVDILTYFSALGEIDLFYALITTLSIFLIFNLGERKQYWLLFLSVYLLTAIGFLTKGLTALPFTAVSLLVYFIWKKDFRRLIGVQHVSGILIFIGLLFGYFKLYDQYADVSGWWSTLYAESADKAAGGGVLAILKHVFLFPFDSIKVMLPATFFIPLLFVKGAVKKLKEQDFVWFCVLIFLFNYPVYLFSAEAKSRYIYPIIPMAIIALTYLAVQFQSKFTSILLRLLAYFIPSVLMVALVATPFFKELVPVDSAIFYTIALAAFLAVSLFLLFKEKLRPYIIVISSLVVLKVAISAFVPVIRRDTSGAAYDKRVALEMANIKDLKDIYRYENLRISLGMVFYLERELGQVLSSKDLFEGGHYFATPYQLKKANVQYNILKNFMYRDQEVYLIKVN